MDASLVIVSGGSACNDIAPAFQNLTQDVRYILGISDNGGSTSELLRVLGGPSIGDLRARLTRLINENASPEKKAIKDLLSYRLPSEGDAYTIRHEWSLIVQGRHKLWNPISTDKKEAIRGFLVMFNFEILKRAYKNFNFRNGSIGNFFLTGARLFYGSLEAAIFIFAAITGIAEETSVVPVIITSHTASIAAELQDGTTLRGQCEISHPGSTTSNIPSSSSSSTSHQHPIDVTSLPVSLQEQQGEDEEEEDKTNANLVFNKTTDQKLSAAVRRIYYMNEFGQEVFPWPNPKFIKHLTRAKTLIYSIGSLYTSIVPCLILRGIGQAVANSPSLKHKILILNGSNDRETEGYSALDFVQTITEALNQSQWVDTQQQGFFDAKAQYEGYPLPIDKPIRPSIMLTKDTVSPPSAFFTHMIYLTNSRKRRFQTAKLFYTIDAARIMIWFSF
ncbi:hypothetical protein BDB00DRAFT_797022 [Zychaea mexicana]|uniref:uncharacterized protein n=1 Tax=Zychaea mexicana TaxID=64656 RepID=UPI0022FEA15E|nr:uncharacterized protein BDB00DRAFT_797022 [Zychaea mexicana]KAI9498868.1 hypothetical protein BDB00DRAFT_797022 [Zychaea mexicana]